MGTLYYGSSRLALRIDDPDVDLMRVRVGRPGRLDGKLLASMSAAAYAARGIEIEARRVSP